MAKEQKMATGSIASRTTVRPHSQHDGSPDLFEIIVSKRRVAYITAESPHPVTWLVGKRLGPFELTAVEKKEIIEHVRPQVQKLAEEAAGAVDELDRLSRGE